MTSNQPSRVTPWIAARALLTGWGLWTLFILWVLPRFVGGNIGVAIAPSDPIGTAWTILTAPIGIQAAVGRPFSSALAFGLPLIIWALCGWLVATFHRGQQVVVVLLLAGSVLLMNLLVGGYVLRGGFAPVITARQLAANAAVSIVGILAGGVVLRGHSKTVSN